MWNLDDCKEICKWAEHLGIILRCKIEGHDPRNNINLLGVFAKLRQVINPYPANVDNMASSYQC